MKFRKQQLCYENNVNYRKKKHKNIDFPNFLCINFIITKFHI
jgi:hypothetical protein